MTTVRYKVDFAKSREERRLRARSAPGRERRATGTEKAQPDGQPTCTAMLLAAAYATERKLAEGSLRGFQDVVDLLGASPSWASQVLNLLNLRTEIQEAIIDGQMLVEGRLRKVANVVEWERQRS
jgi:ribosomal protein L30/L7E